MPPSPNYRRAAEALILKLLKRLAAGRTRASLLSYSSIYLVKNTSGMYVLYNVYSTCTFESTKITLSYFRTFVKVLSYESSCTFTKVVYFRTKVLSKVLSKVPSKVLSKVRTFVHTYFA